VDDANGPLDAAGNPFGLEKPHEILGLAADESEPGAIIRAARQRLDAVRDAGGSDEGVRAAVVSLIVAARQALLQQAGSTSEAGRADDDAA